MRRKHIALGIALATAIGLAGCMTDASYDVRVAATDHPVKGQLDHVIVRTVAVQQDFANGATGHFMDVAVTNPINGKVLAKGTYAFNDEGVARMVFKTVAPAIISAGGSIAAAHAIRPSNINVQGGKGGESISLSGAFANAASAAGASVR